MVVVVMVMMTAMWTAVTLSRAQCDLGCKLRSRRRSLAKGKQRMGQVADSRGIKGWNRGRASDQCTRGATDLVDHHPSLTILSSLLIRTAPVGEVEVPSSVDAQLNSGDIVISHHKGLTQHREHGSSALS
jgi:hypothetical protein